MPERLTGPSRWGMRTRLALLLAAAGLVLAFTLATQLVVQDRQQDLRSDLLRRYDPAMVATTDLRAAVIDQDTGVRAYALTGDPDFLDVYTAGRETTAAMLDRLDDLLTGDERIEPDIARLEAALDDWRAAALAPVLDAGSDAERAAVRTDAFEEEALQRLETVRSATEDIEDDLVARRAAVTDDLEATARRARLAMFLQAAGVVLAGVVVAAALARVVLGPLDRLGQDARRVADGDLDHEVRGTGSPDLVRLGTDVDAMRTRIVGELAQLNAATADLERQAAELARSNADLEQFAYVASHDLQEPLRKVSGFCQLLQKRYGGQLDERADEYIHYAVDGAKRMQDLINDLLAFSRVGRTTAEFEPVDLQAVVGDSVRVHDDAIASAGARVVVGDLPVVPGDRRLLGAAFQNLIGNALKFRSDEAPVVEVAASLDGSPNGDEWTVTVRDNGIGIDPDYRDQIFVIFKRLHGRTDYAGTGIGLALVKKIVEYHGGRVWLDPTPGKGSTFKLALPAGPTAGDTTDAG
ncbi:MAG TPA: ATP-binding protein [Acidimicrobiales bacterium]